MNNIREFILAVKSSRKRTGVVYCYDLFDPVVKQFKSEIPHLDIFDCTELYENTLTLSAKDLLDLIEYSAKNKPTIVTSIESFIVSNSATFSAQLAKLATYREPLNPIFFFFYSKKIFNQFKVHYEAKELNHKNIIEF